MMRRRKTGVITIVEKIAVVQHWFCRRRRHELWPRRLHGAKIPGAQESVIYGCGKSGELHQPAGFKSRDGEFTAELRPKV